MSIKVEQICLSAILSLAIITPVNAQDDVIEEVIVTATKREQTLQEVPVAVSVTDSDVIEKAQILDINDLQSVVPSLRVTQLQSSTNTNFVIRGFGNGANNAGIEPSVGVFIDGVYRSRSAGAISDLPNLQRVEVLRGPQSTLFGKNASAGVISVVTAKPNSEFGGSAEVTLGNYGLAIAKADVTGGITENLAYSLSGSYNVRDGYYDNLASTSDEFNERDRSGFRGQLLYTPTVNMEFRLIADADTLDENCCGVANLVAGPTAPLVDFLFDGNPATPGLIANDPFAYEGFYNKASQSKVDNSGVSLQADFNLNSFDITSITSVRNQEIVFDQDADFSGADLLGNVGLDQEIDTFTQEVRFTSSTDGAIDWMVGGFYFSEDVEAAGDVLYGSAILPFANALIQQASGGALNVAALEAIAAFESSPIPNQDFTGQFYVPGSGLRDFSTQEDDALSLFGQVDWHINDSSILTIGLNHTTDEKTVTSRHVNDDTFSSIDIETAFFNFGFFDAFAPAFGATFFATDANIAFVESIPLLPTGISGAEAIAQIRAVAAGTATALAPLQFLPQFVEFPNQFESGKSDDSDTTYTIRFAKDINDNLNFYASVGTGFKATSWNLSRDSRPTQATINELDANGFIIPNNLVPGTRFAGPEESKVYEIGFKAKFAQGAINVAVFDQDITGFQSNVFNGTGFNLANAGKQSTQGLELDFLYDINDQLTLTFAGTFLDPLYDEFQGASGLATPGNPTGITDLSGTRPAGIHDISTSTSATYSFNFSNGWDAFIRGDYIYESDTRVNENTPASFTRQVNSLNGSFGVETTNGWGMTLWGRNLTDNQYLLSSFPSVAQAGSFSGYPNQPRTYGLTVRKEF